MTSRKVSNMHVHYAWVVFQEVIASNHFDSIWFDSTLIVRQVSTVTDCGSDFFQDNNCNNIVAKGDKHLVS